MGEAKRKKKRKQQLLSEMQKCIFCNGAASTTIDHIPSRECFINRVGPEDYEFGACINCNNSTAQIEQIVALYIHTSSNKDEISPQFEKLMKGINNNNPNALPKTNMTANQKRRALKDFYTNPINEDFTTFADAPVVEIPEEALSALKIFNRKLSCAIYFKETSKILPQSAFISTIQAPLGHNVEKKIIEFSKNNLPNMTTTKRKNTDIGNQFVYLWNSNDENTLFSYTAQFQQSFLCFGAIFLSKVSSSLPIKDYWISHQADIENNWEVSETYP